MRRTVLSLFGFCLAVTVLVGLKAPATARVLGWSAEAGLDTDPLAADGTAPGSGASPGSPGAPGASGSPAPGTSPGASPTAGATSPGAASSAPGGTTTSAAAPPPPPPAKRTITGPGVATVWNGSNYGTTQVQIVVTGTHIDDIIALKQGSRPGTTATTLRAQALAAQSANVGNVSGATASSNAYKQSLQGAINLI